MTLLKTQQRDPADYETRTPIQNTKKSGAAFSPCRKYRYALWRIWNKDLPACLFIGLNPSTADETNNDPTIRRCIGFARDWGYGGLYMANIFAFRATNPAKMKAAPNPIGPENDKWLNKPSNQAAITICAWGIHGTYMDRDKDALCLLYDAHCLALTNDGHPRHPLYLKKDCKPIKFDWDGE